MHDIVWPVVGIVFGFTFARAAKANSFRSLEFQLTLAMVGVTIVAEIFYLVL